MIRSAEPITDIIRADITFPIPRDVGIIEVAKKFEESPTFIITAHNRVAADAALYDVNE